MTGAAVAARSDLRAWYWLAPAALAVLAVIVVEYWRDQAEQPVAALARLDPADLRPGLGPATFAEALVTADREVAGARLNVAQHRGEWLRMERAALAHMARYRLTGSPADLSEAGRILDQAMKIAPWPAGPSLSRAAVVIAAHDLDKAEAALDRFDAWASPGTMAEQAEARSLRCEIAFQRGRLDEARRSCGASGDLSLQLRRANIAAKTGDPAEAVRLIEDLLRRPGQSPQVLATLALQRAAVALAQGDWEASGRWSRAAERIFPGYWLSEAFVAQQYALEGNRAEARRRYAALVERTGDADILDALARLAEADGLTADAQDWARRAGMEWEARAGLLPGTYDTHHAEHLLLHGDRRRALAMAEADYRRRPFPGTIVHYGYALWRSGQAAKALEVVRKEQQRGFAAAEMKLVEAVALGSLNRAAEAGAALAEARRMNPRIDSSQQQFVAFGRD